MYNGHGKKNKDEKSIWVYEFNPSLSNWGRILIAFRPGDGTKAELRWSIIEGLLEDFESDILCIIDSCFAATAGVGAKIEILAATGIAELAQGPGDRSFTDFLISAMKSFDQPFNVAMLHARMLSRRFRVHGGRTPIYISRQDRVKPSTFLCRVPPPTLASVGRAEDEFSNVREPRVLIKFSLDVTAAIPDIQQWITYLTTNMPAHIKRGEINIEGVYRSGSTAVLLTCPIWVWSCLEARGGMQFVTFVDSGNLLSQVRRRGDWSSEETYVDSPASASGPSKPV